jgi:hypothetical protein
MGKKECKIWTDIESINIKPNLLLDVLFNALVSVIQNPIALVSLSLFLKFGWRDADENLNFSSKSFPTALRPLISADNLF